MRLESIEAYKPNYVIGSCVCSKLYTRYFRNVFHLSDRKDRAPNCDISKCQLYNIGLSNALRDTYVKK